MTRRFVSRTLALVFLLVPTGAAAQGQLQAGPTMLELADDASATRLMLRNTGDRPVAARLRVYAWLQDDGEDRLVPTDDLVVSPPIEEVAPGGQQLVRVVRLGDAPAQRDRTYRIVVDELPGPADQDGVRIAVRMRYVIPVFVRAAGAAAPDLSCRLEQASSRLACENTGGRAAQLGASRLLNDEGEAVTLSAGLFGYVLPGSRRVWPLSDADDMGDGPVRLETELNGQHASLTVARSP